MCREGGRATRTSSKPHVLHTCSPPLCPSCPSCPPSSPPHLFTPPLPLLSSLFSSTLVHTPSAPPVLPLLLAPLSRLQTSRTQKFVRGFVSFLAHFTVKDGPAAVAATMDRVQPGIFVMLLQQVWDGCGSMEVWRCGVAATMDRVQPGIFVMLLQQV